MFHVMRLYPPLGGGAAVVGNATRYDMDAAARLAADYASRRTAER